MGLINDSINDMINNGKQGADKYLAKKKVEAEAKQKGQQRQVRNTSSLRS